MGGKGYLTGAVVGGLGAAIGGPLFMSLFGPAVMQITMSDREGELIEQNVCASDVVDSIQAKFNDNLDTHAGGNSAYKIEIQCETMDRADASFDMGDPRP